MSERIIDIEKALRVLTENRVEFIVIGGVAATLHQKLIQMKRAAGRPKDLESIAELQALLEDRDAS